jgi:hypothetical protein
MGDLDHKFKWRVMLKLKTTRQLYAAHSRLVRTLSKSVAAERWKMLKKTHPPTHVNRVQYLYRSISFIYPVPFIGT